jgi:SAM-dependent methyltransferase
MAILLCSQKRRLLVFESGRKHLVTHISQRQTQFFYFDQLLAHPVWKGSKILDFGGNVGGFLSGAGDSVDHDDYWCLDVTKSAIEQGNDNFPRAHFVHYNRYSSYFNPDGIPYLAVPDLGLKFSYILAFSVFTHTHLNEMIELVRQLRSKLAPHGVLAFTFSDPSYDQSLSDPALPRGTGILPMFDSSSGDPRGKLHLGWCVVIDEEVVMEPGKEYCQQKRRGRPGESYCSYFTTSYMMSLFPKATIRPPVAREWQHCCILSNSEE